MAVDSLKHKKFVPCILWLKCYEEISTCPKKFCKTITEEQLTSSTIACIFSEALVTLSDEPPSMTATSNYVKLTV